MTIRNLCLSHWTTSLTIGINGFKSQMFVYEEIQALVLDKTKRNEEHKKPIIKNVTYFSNSRQRK